MAKRNGERPITPDVGKEKHRRRLLALIPVLTILTLVLAPPAAATPPVVFTHGIASGDVTPVSAVLWTRVNQQARLTVEVSTDPAFAQITLRRSILASAEDDFTAKVLAAPLAPGQVYHYRWRHLNVFSEVGTFTTAPSPFHAASVRFAYSADSDGTMFGGVPFFNEFEVLNAARLDGLDFFIYLGDTIYSDSVLRPAGPAITLDDYREAYKVNRGYANLRNLMRSTSTYVLWDDHEVHDNFDSETVDPSRFANGREAFEEYMPVEEVLRLRDEACADDPMFRVVRWGKDVELIILDERSCRSAEAVAACTFPTGLLDPAPTLPGFLRPSFGLPSSPPPGCLEAIFDPGRTLLGGVQKAVFQAVLQHSTAKFKFVINEVPIQQLYFLPYDRWEGYGAERAEVLNVIRGNGIENVIFLTTDSHAVLVNDVVVDTFFDPQPIAPELVTGPIATFTLEEEALFFGGPPALAALHALLSIAGVDCRNLNIDSYGLVDVDLGAGTVTISMKDSAGAMVSDQFDSTIACMETIGP